MRNPRFSIGLIPAAALFAVATSLAVAAPRVTGDLLQWHKITLTIDGPTAHENDTQPDPFLDYRMDVTFTHESGSPGLRVPGYFAADDNDVRPFIERDDPLHCDCSKLDRWQIVFDHATALGLRLHLAGGALQPGTVDKTRGPGAVALGAPPAEAGEDWVILVRKRSTRSPARATPPAQRETRRLPISASTPRKNA